MVVGGNLQPALHYCPQRRRQLMRTVYELDYILRNAELIHPGEVDGIIHLGSTVVVQEEGAELETYTLVGPAEANPCEGCISNRSPLGRALLDHTIGDEVEIKTPDGSLYFRIIALN